MNGSLQMFCYRKFITCGNRRSRAVDGISQASFAEFICKSPGFGAVILDNLKDMSGRHSIITPSSSCKVIVIPAITGDSLFYHLPGLCVFVKPEID